MNLARLEGLKSPAPAAKMVALGPNRVVAALQMRVEGPSNEFVLVLLLLDHIDGKWMRSSMLPIHRWAASLSHQGVAVSMKVDDYDQDGTPEMIVRYRFVLTCPGGGDNVLTRGALVEVREKLFLALDAEIKHHMDNDYPEATKGRLKHEDINGDGYMDAIIDYVTSEYDDETERTRTHANERRFIFDPASRRYREDLSVPNRYVGSNCDW